MLQDRHRKKNNRKKKKSSNVINLILILVLLAGISLMLYPSVSDWWNSYHQTRAVASYVEKTADMTSDENDQIFAAAQEYNKRLAASKQDYELTKEQEKEYYSLLDVTGTGIMGYIKIPEINVELPIYHGTSDTVLEIAVGHIEWSSLPVGGESTHAVLSGHRGLPSAKLFTDLVDLKEGDTFTLNILDRTLTYEVDQIRTVLPNELGDLQITDGKDYCTLVTCTPYSVNTHRLLVRGHRIANAADNVRVVEEARKVDPVMVAPFIGAFIAIVLLIWLFTSTHSSKKDREFMEEFRKLAIGTDREENESDLASSEPDDTVRKEGGK